MAMEAFVFRLNFCEGMGEPSMRRSEGGAKQRYDSDLGLKSSSAPLDPASLSVAEKESLSAAEEAAQKVLNCIHPTLDSEEKRRDIIDYLQRLIKSHLNCEVLPYGSVPLKTYLPDGDIDLTAVNGTNNDESLALDVLDLLRREENFENAEFIIKDTQYIDAEVKLVKCLVRETVIDISFNQLGGLSTLCFLEQVDRLVGRNHLFKRSIILIKAWCFYESRILGAHHGLISTYALETLVLYIFHLYNLSLCGPLMVLYKFLEYYSKFDWENYCISLKGPVCKSSLPNVVAKVPESGRTNLMFSEEFLENCMEMFSVSSPREVVGKPKAFQPKHLNIIDPLKQNNNLGRSVHIGNFYRIRSAFKYGARKLGQVLSLPFEKVADEIYKFFSNAIARHGNYNKYFIEHLALELGNKESFIPSLSLPVEVISEENMPLRLPVNGNDGVEFKSENEKDFSFETPYGGWYPTRVNLRDSDVVETYDVSTSNSCLRNDIPYDLSHSSDSTSSNCRDPLCFFSKLSAENQRLETENFLKRNLTGSASQEYDFKSCSKETTEHGEVNYRHLWCMDNPQVDCTNDLGASDTKANNVDDMVLYKDLDLMGMVELEAFNPLADLTGDYDSHIRSLLYGQLCHGFSLAAIVHRPSSIPSWTENNKRWDLVNQSEPFWRNRFSQTTWQPIPIKQSNCRTADSAPHAPGSGSHLPCMNNSVRDRHPLVKSRKSVSGCCDQFSRHRQSNGVHDVASGVKNKENSCHDEEKGRSQHQRTGDAKCTSPRSVPNGNQTNGNLSRSWRIEFGSLGNLAEEIISCSADSNEGSTQVQERLVGTSIHLKNESEFPPLC